MDLQKAISPRLTACGMTVCSSWANNTDISFVAAVISETIEADAAAELAEEDDVMLEPDIGPRRARQPGGVSCAKWS
jgi:hypothetical protein